MKVVTEVSRRSNYFEGVQKGGVVVSRRKFLKLRTSECVEVVRQGGAVTSLPKKRMREGGLRRRSVKGQNRAGRGRFLWKGVRRNSLKGQREQEVGRAACCR